MTLHEFAEDAELVAASLAGDREAFGRVVQRYQSLLCSLAYSATGSLSASEDLAQDAFLDAWRQLASLREPEKLRSWLCGILRNKIRRLRRSDTAEPVRHADGLEFAEEIPSDERPAADLAMDKEEQAILWKALERVPDVYREPLVLFYREHRSVEHVAVALDLSEDAVKQRLARGRKILQERVLAFVEGALSRSAPGPVFTLSVLAALPAMTAPAKAAGLGAAAAHGTMIAKSTGIAAILASCAGVVSAVLTLRANLDLARTPRERRAVVKVTLGAFGAAVGWLAVMYAIVAIALRWPETRVPLAWVSQAIAIAFIVAWPLVLIRIMRWMRAMRSAERREHPECFQEPRDRVGAPGGEYRSRFTLFGVPLVHVRYSWADETDRPVFAWVAGGDRAYGLLCAWGGWAVAPISVGAFSVGILSIGSVSLGLISIGTAALGFAAMGCVSIGVKAFAWLSALGWQTAMGSGFSIARHVAGGPIVFAKFANDPVALKAAADAPNQQSQVAFLIAVSLLTLIPVACYARAVRQRFGPRSPK